MDGDTDGDGAINLSTSQRPSAANTPNGSIDFEDSGQVRVQLFSFENIPK